MNPMSNEPVSQGGNEVKEREYAISVIRDNLNAIYDATINHDSGIATLAKRCLDVLPILQSLPISLPATQSESEARPKYELCGTIFDSGARCVRPINHHERSKAKCSPTCKFMEYSSDSQVEEAKARQIENNKFPIVPMPLPQTAQNPSTSEAQPECLCSHLGYRTGYHRAGCELKTSQVERPELPVTEYLRKILFNKYAAVTWGTSDSKMWLGVWVDSLNELLDALSRNGQLERKGGEVCSVLGNLGIHIHELGLRSRGKIGQWQYRNERAEKAEAELSQLKAQLAAVEGKGAK